MGHLYHRRHSPNVSAKEFCRRIARLIERIFAQAVFRFDAHQSGSFDGWACGTASRAASGLVKKPIQASYHRRAPHGIPPTDLLLEYRRILRAMAEKFDKLRTGNSVVSRKYIHQAAFSKARRFLQGPTAHFLCICGAGREPVRTHVVEDSR